ncbi:hypothetical protein [Nocardioides sp. YIM 152315]|uniref:hypothetical protein n=1 Tax=Nocardioides sp. YIM 152315 TaxID=3031760 RepID=UPI0023DCAF48|nr:hypothetical protein [Nocardioides sp. YIM 152315]MDF1604085.1 hypothetical protein [Nocardioides sp. YIM 152315]
MTTHFVDVLAIEDAALAQVTNREDMTRWRRRVVRELMRPQSRYATALRRVPDSAAGRDFLVTWQGLLTAAVERVLSSENPPEVRSAAGRRHHDRRAADELAVLILAALHGGGLLSRVADDPAPLEAALDIALAPLTTPSARRGSCPADERPGGNMNR